MENVGDGAAAQAHAFYDFAVSGHAAKDAVEGQDVCGRRRQMSMAVQDLMAKGEVMHKKIRDGLDIYAL